MAIFYSAVFTEDCEMDFYETMTLTLMKKNPRLSPAYLAAKLKINMDTAMKLCHWGWQFQGFNISVD